MYRPSSRNKSKNREQDVIGGIIERTKEINPDNIIKGEKLNENRRKIFRVAAKELKKKELVVTTSD